MVELSDRARAFLQAKRFAVLATINPDGTPQLSAMWSRISINYSHFAKLDADKRGDMIFCVRPRSSASLYPK